MKPVLQALILAEHVYTDKSGKKIICGTFNALGLTKSDPNEVSEVGGKAVVRGGIPGSPFAYISLTDICDGTHLELQFVSLKRNKVIFSQSLQLTCKNRLATVEIVAPLPQLIIPEPGIYAFEIVCEGEILGSSRILAELDDKDDK